MPFTLAHPAAVLPLRDRGLPMTAMVAGSMVPDIPQFVQSSRARDLSHSLLGVVTIDLAMGLAALLLWYGVYRRPLVDLAFDPWRGRLTPTVPLDLPTVLLFVPAVLVGALTHVGWDAFTHEDGWFVERLSPLRASSQGVAVYDVLQLAFSAVALVVVVGWSWRHLSGLPDLPARPAPVVGRWALVVTVCTAALLGMGVSALVAPYGLEAATYYAAVTPILVLAVGITGVCVWWQVKRRWVASRRRSGGDRS